MHMISTWTQFNLIIAVKGAVKVSSKLWFREGLFTDQIGGEETVSSDWISWLAFF